MAADRRSDQWMPVPHVARPPLYPLGQGHQGPWSASTPGLSQPRGGTWGWGTGVHTATQTPRGRPPEHNSPKKEPDAGPGRCGSTPRARPQAPMSKPKSPQPVLTQGARGPARRRPPVVPRDGWEGDQVRTLGAGPGGLRALRAGPPGPPPTTAPLLCSSSIPTVHVGHKCLYPRMVSPVRELR